MATFDVEHNIIDLTVAVVGSDALLFLTNLRGARSTTFVVQRVVTLSSDATVFK